MAPMARRLQKIVRRPTSPYQSQSTYTWEAMTATTMTATTAMAAMTRRRLSR